MKHTILTAMTVGVLACAAIPATFATADAMPTGTIAAQPLPLASAVPGVTLVSGGCGVYGHRGVYGHCRANFGRFYGYHPYRSYGWHRRYFY